MSATLSPQQQSTATQAPGARRQDAPAAAWVWWACLSGLFVWMFADVLFGANSFVYRDAAHFYHPLFKYVAAEWGAGRVPLWNPYENLGTPLVAQGTSSVFYPGKLLFVLPVGFDVAFKLYVLVHVLLAAALAYRLARRWGSSVEAAALCSLSYAFGGNVVFQCCNVVFLVGAAWLPLAVEQIDRLFAGRRLRTVMPLGAILALMVLGGDPQMAYHVVLLGALYAWLRRKEHLDCWQPPERSPPEAQTFVRRLSANRLVLLGASGAVAAALAAVQILPSWELNSLSERAAHDQPRNVYETAAGLFAADDQGSADGGRWNGLLARQTDGDSHTAQAYDFSVGPWRLAEYVWPNVAGREFPANRRWLSALPAEGRVWVPSFYMGLLPLALALAAWRVRRADARTMWLSGMVLLGVLGSFGVFGLGRLMREVAVSWKGALADPSNATVGDPFGGLYWLLTVLLPGYAEFRYPAKLLVVAALGLSVLAGRGWDEVVSGSPTGRRTRRLLVTVVATSAAGLIVAATTGRWWSDWLSGATPNPLFGPVDAAGAWWDLCGAFAQTAVVGGIAWWMMDRCIVSVANGPSADEAPAARRWAYAALALTALDIGVANRWMIATAPTQAWQSPAAVAQAIRANKRDDSVPFRVDRPIDDWWPKSWKAESSPTRQIDGLAWDRNTLLPKHAMSSGIEMLHAPDTSAVLDYEVFLDQIERWGESGGSDRHPGGLDVLGVKYLVVPPGTRPPQPETWRLVRPAPSAGSTAVDEGQRPTEIRLWANVSPMPRAWIVRQIDVLPTFRSGRPDEIAERTSEVLFPHGQPRDFRTTAAVETDDSEAGRIGNQSTTPDLDRCAITLYQPGSVELEAEVAEPGGLLVVSDLYYPGWRVEVVAEDGHRQPRPILRTNRVMRGVPLPAGKQRVTFSYQPASVFWGAGVSGVAWFALLGFAAMLRFRKQQVGSLD